MIPVLRKRRGVGAGGVAGLPVVSIPHTKNGTFSIVFRGTNGSMIYCDPGDGSAVQVKTMLGPSTDVTFSYSNGGALRVVRVYGAIDQITKFNIGSNSLTGRIEEFVKFKNLTYLRTTSNLGLTGNVESVVALQGLTFLSVYQNGLKGDAARVAELGSLTELYLGVNSLTYSTGSWPTFSSGTVLLQSCISSSPEVDQWLIDLAAAGWNNCTITIDGTNPVRTSASDAAVATLLGNGCTVNVNE